MSSIEEIRQRLERGDYDGEDLRSPDHSDTAAFLLAEVDKLAGIVRELAAEVPEGSDGDGTWCALCFGESNNQNVYDHYDHKPECPYLQAKTWSEQQGGDQ